MSKELKKIFVLSVAAGLLLTLFFQAAAHFGGFGQWRGYQRQYNKLRASQKQAPIAVGVRELQPQQNNAKQRCVTCHLGTVLEHAPQKPFTKHPKVDCPLAIEQQGCTFCHRGEPHALTVKEAHGLDQKSRRRVLDWQGGADRQTYLQAGCASCHYRRENGVLKYSEAIVPAVAAGEQIFFEQGCSFCHQIDGLYNAKQNAPSLSRVGLKYPRPELLAILLKPRSLNPSSPMPPLSLSLEKQKELVTFLLAQTTKSEAGRKILLTDHFATEEVSYPNPATGARWLLRAGCAGCHVIGEKDNGVVDLRRVGWYRSEEELANILDEPTKYFAGTLMARLELPVPLKESIVQYLALQQRPYPTTAAAMWQQVCGKCHSENRDPKSVVLAKTPPSLNLTREKFEETVRNGRSRTAMIGWGRMFGPRFISELYQHKGEK